MRCHYLPTISSYHDGELAPAQAADVESHLASCGPCAAELRALRRMSSIFAGDLAPALSQVGRMRVLAGLRASERNRQIAAIARPFAAAASLILAIGLPVLLMSSTETTASASTAPTWEAAMLSRDSESVARSTSQDQLADWVAADLTGSHR